MSAVMVATFSLPGLSDHVEHLVVLQMYLFENMSPPQTQRTVNLGRWVMHD